MKGLAVSLALVLGLTLFAEWYLAPVTAPQLVPHPTPAPAGRSDPAGVGQGFVVPLDDSASYEVIAQRPLFSDTRRPAVAEESEESAPEVVTEGVEGLDLNAVIITTDETVALVRDAKTGDTRRVQTGQEVRGWTVEDIDPGSLRLKLGDKTATIVLREFGPSAPAQPPKQVSLQEQRRQRALRLRAQRQRLQEKTQRGN